MSWSGTENLREGLAAQRAFLASKNPSYARILELLEADLPSLEERLQPLWRERRFDARYERVSRALASRFVQTNETSRAVAWMWVARLVEEVDPDRTLALVDLGTSAGLNLVADSLPSPWDDAEGRAVPTGPLPRILSRIGLDLRPLDALDRDTQAWLRACVWPGDAERLARLDAGLAALERAATAGELPALEAVSLDEAAERLRRLEGADRVLAVQTIVRDYLPEPVRARHVAGMRSWLAAAPAGRALWVELENTEDVSNPHRMAALSIHLVTEDGTVRTIELARTHPHPRRLFINRDAVRELKRALAGRGRGSSARC